jgi:hypothetical protein
MTPHELLDTALTSDPIDALAAIRHLREQLAEAELKHITTLRRHNASWGFIARHLGTSRQDAHRRFSHWTAPTTT